MAVSQQPANEHTVNQDWVDGNTVSLWHEVAAINALLAELENIERIASFHGNTKWASELRQTAGGCRVERDRCKDRATQLEMADK